MVSLASVFVTVKPDTALFGGLLLKQMAGVDGKAAGAAVGAQFSSGITAAASSAGAGAAAAAKVNLESAVVAAERGTLRLDAARDTQLTAAGRVRVAEAQLAAVMDSGTASAARIAAAEERLAVVRRGEVAATAGVAASEAELARAQEAVVARQAEMEAAQVRAAASAGTVKTAYTGLASTITGLATVVIAGYGIKSAADYQQALTKLVTTAGETQGNLKGVGAGMLSMAGDVGISAQHLAEGMYTVESAGFHGADALNVLKASAQGARQENASLSNVTNAVTTALHDYNLPASSAALVTSQLITAVSHGKTTFDDLTGAMHSVTPLAAALHIPLADVAGSLAAMTASGESADQASQNMADALRHLQSPTQSQTKTLAQLGITATDLSANLGKRGLSGSIQDISAAILAHMGPAGTTLVSSFNQSQVAARDATVMFNNLPPAAKKVAQSIMDGTMSFKEYRKTGGDLPVMLKSLTDQWLGTYKSSEGFSQSLKSGSPAAQNFTAALKSAMGTSAGLTVALQLTGEHAANVNAAIADIGRASAQADGNIKGWAEVQGNFNQKLAETGAALKSWSISLGQALLPAATAVLGVIQALVGVLIQHQAIVKVAALTVLGLTAAWGEYVVVTKLATLAQAAWTFGAGVARLATLALTGQFAALSTAMDANPIGLIVVALTALAVGFKVAFDKVGWFHDGVIAAWGGIKAAFDAMNAAGMAVFHALASALAPLGAAFTAFGTKVREVFTFLKNLFTGGDFTGDMVKAFNISASQLGIVHALDDVRTAIVDLFTGKSVNWGQMGADFKAAITGALTGAGSVLRGLASMVLGWVGDASRWLVSTGAQVITGLVAGIATAAPAVGSWFAGLAGKVTGWVGSALTWLFHAGVDAGTGLVNGLVAGVPAVMGWLVKLGENVGKWVGAADVWLIGHGVKAIAGLLSGMVSGAVGLASWLAGMAPRVIGWIGDAATWLVANGGKLIAGFIKGIIDHLPQIALALAAIPVAIAAAALAIPLLLLAAGGALIFGFIKGIINAIPGLTPALTRVKDAVVGGIQTVMANVASAFSTAWDGIKAAWSAMGAAWHAVAVAMQVVWTSVLKPVWDALGTAGRAMGTAISAVFTAIGTAWNALATGLRKFYDAWVVPVFQLFAAIVMWAWKTQIKVAWDALSLAWNLLAAGLRSAYNTVIKPTWDALGAAASYMWNSVLKPTWAAISAAWNALGVGLKAIYTNLIAPTWTALNTAAQFMWNSVLKPTWATIQAGWNALWAAVRATYQAVVVTTWNALQTAASFMWNSVLKPTWATIQAGWNALWAAVRATYQAVVVTTWNALQTAASFMWNSVLKPTWAAITGAWNSLGSGIRDVWNTVVKVTFEALSGAVGALGGAFHTAVDAIGRAWDGLKAAASVPVRFVLETVLQHGIIDNFNAVADLFGTKHLPDVWHNQFADGGVLPGYSPGRDDMRFVSQQGHVLDLSGGEGVLRPEVTKALGPEWIERANAAARTGGAAAAHRYIDGEGGAAHHVGAFYGGGIIALGKRLQGMGARVSENVDFGGVAPVHVAGSRHYASPPDDAAIDVNTRPGQSALEQAELKPMAELAKSLGFRTIFMESGHYDHLHVDTVGKGSGTPAGGIIGSIGSAIGSAVGAVGNVLSGAAKAAWGGVSGAAKGVWGSIEALVADPGGMLRKLANSLLGGLPGANTAPGQLVRELPFKVIDAVVGGSNGINAHKGTAPGIYTPGTGGGGGGGTFGGPMPTGGAVTRWAPLVTSTLGELGLSTSSDMVARVLRQIQTESGGNPNAVQGNIGDINNRTGDLAKGLMQVIGATFRGNAGPYLGLGVFNPHANIYAGLHYAMNRYGPGLTFLGQGHGYDTGGLWPTGTAGVNMSGRPERVLDPRQTEAFERLVAILDRDRHGLGQGPTNAQPLIGGDLVLQSTGSVKDDLDEAVFQLRLLARGGVHSRR